MIEISQFKEYVIGEGGNDVNPNDNNGKLIESFYSALAGVTFENRQSLVNNLYAGQQLVLQRMPNNPYDSNAIAVFEPNSMQQVGFIRKYVAANLAPIMDRSDRYVTCKVKEVTGGGDLFVGINILIEIYECNTYYTDNLNNDTTHPKNPADVYKAINMYHIGMKYISGEEGIRDEKEAFKWLLESAKLGNDLAQSFIGMMYSKGFGVERDLRKAFCWMKKAAMQENAQSQYLLGLMFLEGYGTERSNQEGFDWITKAAHQNYVEAQAFLGTSYLTGNNGVTKNLEKAADWLRRAAFKGNTVAQYNLGVMYEEGTFFEEDLKTAISWYYKSAEQGLEKAKNKLEILRSTLKDTDYYIYTLIGSRFKVGGSKKFDCSQCVYSYLDNYTAEKTCEFCRQYEEDDEAPDGFTKVSCAYCLKVQNCNYFWNRGGYGSLPICKNFIVDPDEC